ncbi:CASP PIMP1 [Olea europaea subsp. europaea]|uniref:CASP-like protein n=1 Tax=Olea europaea subsp. europaea TaxID=158383 RepID=A0A8S0TEC1_OLEEU|nr:CASP PIMP1 [Olea europaea subsp. europaea]
MAPIGPTPSNVASQENSKDNTSSAPPLSRVISPIVSLILRILTLVCLFVSLILLTTASHESITFTFFRAYRYLCATIVIGLAYSLLQTAFTIFHVSTGNRIGVDGLDYIDFYGDKVVSYVLATGAAASFGMTQELKNLDSGAGTTKFIMTTDAATSLCLLAFLFTAISSIFSSFALPKRA